MSTFAVHAIPGAEGAGVTLLRVGRLGVHSALSLPLLLSDQAIGLIRGRSGRSAEDAFTQLRAISQAEHRKLADVAQHTMLDHLRVAMAAAGWTAKVDRFPDQITPIISRHSISAQ